MPKYYSRLLVSLLLFTHVLFSQTLPGKEDDFKKMAFDAVLDRTNFIELEPINVHLRFSNRTGKPLIALPPDFLGYTKIKVDNNGASATHEISLIRVNMRRFMRTFESEDFVEEKLLLDTNLDLLFPNPGHYTIQFTLGNGKG
jgi:hypothetical protein